MCEKENAIYGDGIERPEVVMIIDDAGTVRREVLRNVRAANDHIIIADLKPNWIQGLSRINIEPLKRKEGLADMRGNGFGTSRDYKNKEDEY